MLSLVYPRSAVCAVKVFGEVFAAVFAEVVHSCCGPLSVFDGSCVGWVWVWVNREGCCVGGVHRVFLVSIVCWCLVVSRKSVSIWYSSIISMTSAARLMVMPNERLLAGSVLNRLMSLVCIL